MQLDLSRPALAAYKSEAKTLRQSADDMTHAQALETVARNHGVRDWNTLHAQANKPVRLSPGMRVTGHYIGQPFSGVVKGAQLWGSSGDRMRVTLHFDTPVDVVTFDSFSALRQRVSGVIDPEGRSVGHTSDGEPHLRLETAVAV